MTNWEKDQKEVEERPKDKPDKLGKSKHRILTFSEMKNAGVAGCINFNPLTDYLGPERIRNLFVKFRRNIVSRIKNKKNLYISGDTFSGYVELASSIATAALVYRCSAFVGVWHSQYVTWRGLVKEPHTHKSWEDLVDVDTLVLIDVPGTDEHEEDLAELKMFRDLISERAIKQSCTVLVSFLGRHKVKDVFDRKTAELIRKYYRKFHCPAVGVCPTRQHKEQWGDIDLSKDFDGDEA